MRILFRPIAIACLQHSSERSRDRPSCHSFSIGICNGRLIVPEKNEQLDKYENYVMASACSLAASPQSRFGPTTTKKKYLNRRMLCMCVCGFCMCTRGRRVSSVSPIDWRGRGADRVSHFAFRKYDVWFNDLNAQPAQTCV